MEETELLPHLFRTEYQKIVSVLCYRFGIEHVEIAEDIVSDTFLSASELWANKGIPQHPTAWLYTVAKNKTKNYLKHHSLFEQKLSPELRKDTDQMEELDIDLTVKNIQDSQLAMIFTVCNPCIPAESQISLALNLLCGFSIQEIADAFLTNREVVYKRIQRAREKLRVENIKIEQPGIAEIDSRLEVVLKTLYLLFSEGYYSISHNEVLRRDFCAEAMRLTYLLLEIKATTKPQVNALLSLMCFHASRFDARVSENGMFILYDHQDEKLWNRELIEKGIYYLNKASTGNQITKYHLEAGIAYWHTHKEDTLEKWENILQLYNHLLIIEYSPAAALNRTYALAKTNGKEEAIREAEKLNLYHNQFYYSLLGNLYTGVDDKKAIAYYKKAIEHTNSVTDKTILSQYINQLMIQP